MMRVWLRTDEWVSMNEKSLAPNPATASTAKPAPVPPPSPNMPLGFARLYQEEDQQLGGAVSLDPRDVKIGVSGEPWVQSTPNDRFGLALSGGGIRSATFNLGLLQALGQLGVLKEVHYLSTVSGGGYVGGFWMTWLHRQRTRLKDNSLSTNERKEIRLKMEAFPACSDSNEGEQAEVRHLREFSRFLLPRVGILETEFWGIVMTVLGGMLPSLLASLSVLVLGWWAWIALLAILFAATDAASSILTALLLLFAYLVISEFWWREGNKIEENNKTESWGYWVGVIVGLELMSIAWPWVLALAFGGQWWPNMAHGSEALKHPTAAFAPVAVLGACMVALIFFRVVVARFSSSDKMISVLVGIERAITRFLGLTCALLGFAILWGLGYLLMHSANKWHALPFTGGGTAVSTGLFLWLHKWLSESPTQTHGGNLLHMAVGVLKRATPKFLATITLLLILLLIGALVEWTIHQMDSSMEWVFWTLPAGCLVIVGLTIWLFNPARVGMHEFYRSRISRCYLGASNLDRTNKENKEDDLAAQNRHTSERPKDDLTLGELTTTNGKAKPLHLICTAANNLSGNPVGTLYRGARSAVLSVHGISMGDETAKLDHQHLSAALTASAAAFNSQMGRISMDLGPAVTFLMSAFNLRLGLWVPHPKNKSRETYTFPGRFFFKELFGRTRTDGKHLHLSDGNHFENFGLYELIRRHCRHIIVSDCGADPEVAFDDLANVLRRVREDFGVEIELDISRLRPGENGLAHQHAVVGTIHYDGPAGFDKGTIIFFKPAMTGDEPPDVLQYHTRNGAFPHESTSDQFYDEAQWESYRRLGEHAGRSVLGFFDRPENKTVDRLFLAARSRWHPAPERMNENFLAMSERCAELGRDLVASGPSRLSAEFFAEAVELAAKWEVPPSKRPSLDEELDILGFLIRVIQIMEDVWVAGNFDEFWSHPLNEGWMNYFHRWAATPSLRRWWPILAPIYSLGFRKFAESRFALSITEQKPCNECERPIEKAKLDLDLVVDTATFKKSRAWLQFLQQHADGETHLHDKKILGFKIRLLDYQGKLDTKEIFVGFALVSENADSGTVRWQAKEFFIPPLAARRRDCVAYAGCNHRALWKPREKLL